MYRSTHFEFTSTNKKGVGVRDRGHGVSRRSEGYQARFEDSPGRFPDIPHDSVMSESTSSEGVNLEGVMYVYTTLPMLEETKTYKFDTSKAFMNTISTLALSRSYD